MAQFSDASRLTCWFLLINHMNPQLGGVMHTVSTGAIILIVGPFHILLVYENFSAYEFTSHPSNDESKGTSLAHIPTDCLPNLFTMYLSKT